MSSIFIWREAVMVGEMLSSNASIWRMIQTITYHRIMKR